MVVVNEFKEGEGLWTFVKGGGRGIFDEGFLYLLVSSSVM
jgi:hypothetical protein